MLKIIKFCQDHGISVTISYTSGTELVTFEFRKYDSKIRKYLYFTRHISAKQLFSSNTDIEDGIITDLIKEFSIKEAPCPKCNGSRVIYDFAGMHFCPFCKTHRLKTQEKEEKK